MIDRILSAALTKSTTPKVSGFENIENRDPFFLVRRGGEYTATECLPITAHRQTGSRMHFCHTKKTRSSRCTYCSISTMASAQTAVPPVSGWKR